MLDLGVWYHLHHRVLATYKEFLEHRKRKELLDHLFVVIEEECWRTDPEVLSPSRSRPLVVQSSRRRRTEARASGPRTTSRPQRRPK
jgi:hypothetical protein